MWTARDDRVFVPLAAVLIALAWLTLVIWGQSPYGRYLSHEELDGVRLGGYTSLWLLFVVGWTVMTVAMMLPTSLPLIVLFRGMTRRRADGARLVALLIGGYLAVWTAFGAVVHLADLLLHRAIVAGGLGSGAALIGAGTFLLAGAYQFTSLKHHCLDKCRSPFAFIAARWSGRRPSRQAFRLGAGHGLYCVGCCWSLMLLMFAVGVGSLGWMFILGTIMAIEKNLPWGRRLSRPLGIWLLVSGLALGLQSTPILS